MAQTVENVLPTTNEQWGFWGTLSFKVSEFELPHLWSLAYRAIQSETRVGGDAVVRFLDSVQGRHFADRVADGLAVGQMSEAAIEAAITQWLTWKIDRKTSKDFGIPHGLPYLTGWLMWHEIELESS